MLLRSTSVNAVGTESLAAVFRGHSGSLDLMRIPVPTPQGSELLLRVDGCTLSSEDVDIFKGNRRSASPAILGHEAVGRIAAFGPDSPRIDASGKSLKIGTRIVWGPVTSCGECFCCTRGLSQKCLRSIKYGSQPFTPGYELLGGLAEHCLLMPGTTIVRVPDELLPEVATLSSGVGSLASAAFRSVNSLQGRSVLIAGAGVTGLIAAAMARSRGAAEVIVTDPDPTRLSRAIRSGATLSVLPNDLTSTVDDVTGGYGVDLALELSDSTIAFELMWPQVRLGGTTVLAGATVSSKDLTLSMAHLVDRNLTIRCVQHYAPHDLVEAVAFLARSSETFELHSLVAQWYSLSDVRQAFKAATDPQSIRIGVRP